MKYEFRRLKTNMSRGIFFILLSVLFFTLMNVFFKYAKTIPVIQRTVLRGLVMSSVMYLIMKREGHSIRDVKKWGILLLRSLFGTAGILINIYVLDKLILSDVGVLSRLSTIFVVLFSAIFLGERLRRIQILSVLVAFTGVVLIVKPSLSPQMVPYLAAIFSSILAAAAYTMLRYLGKTEHTEVIVFVFSTFGVVLLGPIALANWHPMTARELLFSVLAGLSASFAQIFITLAYKYAPAKEISIFEYVGIVFSGFFGILLFGESIDIFSILGYLIVFLSAYIVYLYNKRQH